MEIKFLGMIFVLLGSFGIGIFYRIRYGNRLHNMQDCERALLILQGEMEYGHTPLMEACEEVSVRIGGIVGSFFAQIAKKLNTHEGALETIWCQTARKVLTKSQMEKEEREEWGKIRWYTRISGFGNAGFNHSDLCTPLKTENGANGKRKP